jgi:hypothetical protein
MTLNINRRRQYAQTVDADRSQLPLRNIVSLALGGWTSMNQQAITFGIAYYMDQNCALHEVQLAINEVDRLFHSRFESKLRMIGQGPAYWSKARHTLEGHV